MAKFNGIIGFADETETAPGVWMPKVTDISYFGDILKNSGRISPSNTSTNDNLVLNSQISIVADPFAASNFHKMVYVEYMGSLWKITNVDNSQYPRLLLTTGGVYNGAQTDPA